MSVQQHRHDKFDRDYTADERAFFASFADLRAPLRPPECTKGPCCWVTCGPPSYRTKTNTGACVECGGGINRRKPGA